MIPKFMVWDKDREEFSTSGNLMMDMNGILWWQFGYGITPITEQDRFILYPLTTAHDSKGVEIYAGHIVEFIVCAKNANGTINLNESVTETRVIEWNDTWCQWNVNQHTAKRMTTIGHIATEPEKMEGEDG